MPHRIVTTLCCAVAAILLIDVAPSLSQKINKWKDDKGQWHITDTPGPDYSGSRETTTMPESHKTSERATKSSKQPTQTAAKIMVGKIVPEADGGQSRALTNLRRANLKTRFLTDDVRKVGIGELEFKRVVMASMDKLLPNVKLDNHATHTIDTWLSCDAVKVENFEFGCSVHVSTKSANPNFPFSWDRSISVFGGSQAKPLDAVREALDRLLQRFADDWRRANL